MGTMPDYTESKAVIAATATRAKQLTPQILLQNYFYYRLVKAARAVKCYDTVEFPLLPTVPTKGKWISRGSVLPDSGSESLSMSAWNNRYLAVPIGYNLFDEWEGNGNAARIFQEQEFQAMLAAWGMNRLLSNAVLNGIGGLEPEGLIGKIFEKLAIGSQTETIGNVDKSAKTWWNNQYVALTSNFGTIAAGTTIPAGFLAAMSLLDACTIGQAVPTDFVTTKATYLLFRRGMLETSSAYHLVSDETDVNFGFKTMKFDGVTLGWDPQMPANTILCTHMGSTKMDNRRSGDNTAKLDGDLENATVGNLLDLQGGLFALFNPNVKMKRLEPRTPYRGLDVTEWLVHSFNMGVGIMNWHGLGGSAGTQWETW